MRQWISELDDLGLRKELFDPARTWQERNTAPVFTPVLPEGLGYKGKHSAPFKIKIRLLTYIFKCTLFIG